MKLHLSALLALTASASAFAPAQMASSSTTELSAMSRRDAFGMAFSAAVGAASLLPEEAQASNPALETFKGRKPTRGAFIPGKGIRQQEELIAASNPALQTFKGTKGTKGAYIP